MSRHVEAIIVGGGLAGLAAAHAVGKAGLRAIHLAPKGAPDRRTSALMNPSVGYLRRAGLIDDPGAIGEPLRAIRIIDATDRLLRAPEALFQAQEIGQDAFGWNFPNVVLTERFEAALRAFPNVETLNAGATEIRIDGGGKSLTLSTGESLSCDLLVGADGKRSRVREEGGFRARESGFAEAALVCDLELERPLGHASVEFHYPHGPFTLVPAGGRKANLVWIDERPILEAAIAGGQGELQQVLVAKSQRLFGRAVPLGRPHIFPLSTLSVDVAGREGVVLVGEAAHAFPPIGAQGLNLGLRDAADLAHALEGARRDRPGWAGRLSSDYASRRAADLRRTGTLVDTLFRSLLAEMLPAQAMRSAGLWALRLLPPLRRTAFGIGMGERRGLLEAARAAVEK